MAVDTSIKKPTNAIVMEGKPRIRHLDVETATTMKPGRLVIFGTTTADIVVCPDETTPIGFLGFEQSHPTVVANASGLNSSVDGTYAAADDAAVLYGGGFVVVASCSGTCSAGDYLGPAASGEVKQWATGDTITVGQALEAGTNGADLLVLSFI